MRVTVRDLMTLSLVTVKETATIAETTALVLDQAIGEVYVSDDAGRLLGAVTDYALLKAKLTQTDPTEPVSRIMSRSFLILHPDAAIEKVAGHFRDCSQGRVAVVENGRVIGQLGRREVLRTLLLLDELRAEQKTRHRIEPAEKSMPQKPAYLSADSSISSTAMAE